MQTKRTSTLRLTWKEYPGGVDIVNGVKCNDFTFRLLAGKLGDTRREVAVAHVIFNHATKVAQIEIPKCPETDDESFNYHPNARKIIDVLHASLAKSITGKVDDISTWNVIGKGDNVKNHFTNLGLPVYEKIPLAEYHFQAV